MADTDDLEKLLAEATPGPWEFLTFIECDGTWYNVLGPTGDAGWITSVADAGEEANARLISLAPDLARQVIAQRDRITALEDHARALAEALESVYRNLDRWSSLQISSAIRAALAEHQKIMEGK